jgi:hypothetical protein
LIQFANFINRKYANFRHCTLTKYGDCAKKGYENTAQTFDDALRIARQMLQTQRLLPVTSNFTFLMLDGESVAI